MALASTAEPGQIGASETAVPFVAPDFDTLYETHVDAVSRCLLALGVASASVDDAVQDVFIVAYRKLDAFEGRSTLRTWLLGIALRVAHDYRRTVRRKGSADALSDDLVSNAPCPEEQAARAEALALTTRILLELDEQKRTVFVLAEIEEQTAPEIATLLGIPVNTVYSRLRLARDEFEAILTKSRRTARRP